MLPIAPTCGIKEQVLGHIFQRTEDAERAQPAYFSGTHYFTHENEGKAECYWTMAQELDPDSWNYLPQDLFFEEGGSARPAWRARRTVEKRPTMLP